MDLNLEVTVLCRICLQTAELLTSIYASDESDIKIMDKIYQTTNIEVKTKHLYPAPRLALFSKLSRFFLAETISKLTGKNVRQMPSRFRISLSFSHEL
jgi:hypothetical protein